MLNNIIYKKKSFFKCDVKKLFDFHLDINNISKISPANIKILSIEADNPIKKNSILKIVFRRFFIKQKWEVKIEELIYPSIFIDKAYKSPFKEFVHEHRFIQEEDGVCMFDFIKIKLPFYLLPFKFFIIKDLENTFSYRHFILKRMFHK